jgi:hypothetical protein
MDNAQNCYLIWDLAVCLSGRNRRFAFAVLRRYVIKLLPDTLNYTFNKREWNWRCPFSSNWLGDQHSTWKLWSRRPASKTMNLTYIKPIGTYGPPYTVNTHNSVHYMPQCEWINFKWDDSVSCPHPQLVLISVASHYVNITHMLTSCKGFDENTPHPRTSYHDQIK